MGNEELLEYLFGTDEGASLISKAMEGNEKNIIKLMNASKNLINSIAYDSFLDNYRVLTDSNTGMSPQDIAKIAVESACATFMIYGFVVKEQLIKLELEKLMNS